MRNEIVKYRNIGHELQFSNQQRRTLEQYYDATLLLVDCLNNASDVTPEIRSHIEDTLLYPSLRLRNGDSAVECDRILPQKAITALYKTRSHTAL
ncbi:hypothetical protein H6F98_26385 [Microcoleus sp. FACHB-SPT15]|nr:hypothetical protein [Microcoleus sp. FACHB-SPT15]MBD1808956.1 hypothetical protein [Microcoleus sp. FACHB-SPT15]